MDPQQQFCLKWNSFGNNLVNTFDNLFKSASLTDVTLFCEGVTFQAHKLILAACSKHFQDLFESAPLCPSILIILDGTSSSNMSALLEFMYKGEVHVAQESLSSFLKAAEYLQVKGLSVEQEKLVTQQHSSSADSRVDSPSSSRNTKQNKSLSQNVTTKLEDGNSGRSGHGSESGESMLPPSSPASNASYSTSYHIHHKAQHYEQRPHVSLSHTLPSGYDVLPRKRHPRSPSDSVRDTQHRASVLRDGSKPERESPLSIGYTPPPTSLHHYDPLPPSIPPPVISADGSAAAGMYDRSVKVEKSPSPTWHSNSNCAEDLRVKCESLESGGSSVDENGAVGKFYPGNMDNNQREREISERIPPSQPMEVVPSSPSGSGTTSTWNSNLSSVKIDQPHKGVTTTTTPDGKKLQCPFCERLYGYETNLRAHIRQRHQGIRVPCPFCSRTFTRNNTVRRHIAREHKQELSLKALHQGQVQNHNQ
ncbi:hypothetical protein PGB90_003135 [Kerria lacca]